MQKVTVDLRRLALSGAAACAVFATAHHELSNHRDPLLHARTPLAGPILVQAISFAVPPICPNVWIGAPEVAEGVRATSRPCANDAPTPRRGGEPSLELQGALALR